MRHAGGCWCDQIQGYYLSKPLRPADLVEWLLQGASLKFDPLPHGTVGDTTLQLAYPTGSAGRPARLGGTPTGAGRAKELPRTETKTTSV